VVASPDGIAADTTSVDIDHEPPLAEAQQPIMVQPGGGLCIGIEAAWGRLRRAYLRTLRPGYVRRMAALRQGTCEGCDHDVIDPRDLKLVRNVCGYWFRPEHDRFRWRDRIPLARYGLAEVVFTSALCAPVLVALIIAAARTDQAALWLATTIVAVLWFQLAWFFRDPTRVPTTDPDAMISPADGVVTHIDEVVAPGFPGNRATRISIYLSVWNVHLSRVPRSGRVRSMRYFRGAFLNARHVDCVRRNEQLWLDYVEPNGRMLRVKQFSGALARRLVCHVRPGEEIRAGERFGLIKYGSRMDVLVPTGEPIAWRVRVGAVVAAGTTVLARFGERAP
jgi:phosphatidylserine decarboxylase